ncbi:thiol reductant ABC exporter subunit CydD [Bacillus sp. FJAT-27264]|uniref:thiol reductant ABC exporter subunit CydD n=1 Tax=Paenibacillus sp. (strain DSM 101736 / FJAT-27264) TaxID=1850362 RepID=UPI00080815BA|nr:thiol reductant ABC exporter subunit CydD [Bacillus sp. FJAT-27264]OBZ09784.1 thiol reductant ABC exporter subunit CydD [Bacillus sp. FJAT-27264]
MKGKTSLISQQMSVQRNRLAILAVLSLGLSVAIIGQAVLLADAVQRIFVQGEALSSVVALLGALLAVMAVRSLLSYGNGRIGLNMAASAKKNMRAALLQNMVHASIPSAIRGQAGEKVSIALDAVDEADSYFSQYMPRMIEVSMIPVLILVVVFTQHANSGFIMLCTAPFIPLFMILAGLKTKNKSEEKYAQLAEFSGTFLNAVRGLVTLKIFGQAQRQQQEIERSSMGYRDATMSILRVAFTNTFMLETVVMLSIGIVALELAIQLLIYKSITFHTAFLILLLVPEYYSLFKNTGTAFHSGRTSMGAIRKVEQMMVETNGENQEPKEELEGTRNAEFHVDTISMPPSIKLDNIRFRYLPDSFELYTPSITIGQGQNVAIVGKSGSGKTTLLHLIAGLLRPDSGEVLVNGNLISQFTESEWFERMSYITQHPYIFAGTLAENIAIGTGRNVSRAEIERAASEAGLADLAAQLEHGYDTLVGEGGRGLSGGEQQRLALARAFLKRPSLILFDEPTVGLDLHTERILQKSLNTLAQRATMITVAHRLYTIQHADNILFMDNGVLVDSGRHEELLKTLPQYAEMIHVQREGGLA